MTVHSSTYSSALLRYGRTAFRAIAGALAIVALVAMITPATAQGLFGDGDLQRKQAELTLKVTQLEGQLRSLNGQIEQLTFQIRQMQDLMQKMQKDTDFRLQDLENAGSAPKKPLKKSELAPAAPVESPALAPQPPQSDLASVPDTTDPGGPVPPAGIPGPSRGQLGTPPKVLGQIPTADDPIAGVIGQGPMDLSQGQQRTEAPARPVAPSAEPVPGVSPKYAVAQPTPSARDEYDAAYGYILNGEYELAERSFKTFLNNHPTDKRAGSAQFWLGESYFQRNLHREATDAFLKSYTQYPDDVKAPDSLLKLGLAYQGLGERKAACNAYDELLTKYPKASKALRDRATAEKSRGKCS